MKLIINKDRSVIPVGTWGTVNENDYEIIDFEFPEELENYNKRIVYYLDDTKPWDAIVDNKAYITNAITSAESVKAYIWCTKENSERPADTDFRSQEFEMHFYQNENADGIVPTPVQVDGFNTMLTAMSNKIYEMDALEDDVEAAEADRERRTNEAIENIVDMTEAYNENAEQKTTDFNNNATQKTNDFNTNAVDKTNDFNENAADKTEELNSIAEGIEDMTTAIQFASFEVDNDMHLNIIQAERMPNTNFLFNPDTGRLGVRIYNG